MSSTAQPKSQTNFAKLIATGVIVHDAAPEQKQCNPPWLFCSWSDLVHHLRRSHEPRVWQKCNAAGEVVYYGYNPCTGSSVHGVTEAEMRIWLDHLPRL